MTKIIAIANQKGGVGKTTSTIELAEGLIRAGKKVLVIDLDPQASLTLFYGYDPEKFEEEENTIYFSLLKGKDLGSIVVGGSPSLIPASDILNDAEPELALEENSTTLLREGLKDLKADNFFDYILLDCPAKADLLTINGLTASDFLLIPCQTTLKSIYPMKSFIKTVEGVKMRSNPTLEVLGILPTIFSKNYKHDREALEALKEVVNGRYPVFEAIDRAPWYDRASTYGRSALKLYPHAQSIQNYQLLADKVILHHG